MNKQQHQWSFKQPGSDSAKGPVTEAQFVALVKNGTVRGSTLVNSPTRTGNKWLAVKQIPAVAKLIKPKNVKPADAQPASVKPPKVRSPKVKPLKEENVAAAKPNVNPYAAPVISGASEATKAKPAQDIYQRFKPLNSTAVVWLLRATMLAMATNGILIWCFYHYGRSALRSFGTAQMGVFVVQLILVIATAIFFLRWKYRAYSNLQIACSSPLKTSAGWAVGVYFIPIINLFRPAMAMHEIQSRSQANIGYSVYGWWFLWILSGILARAALNGPGNNNKAVFVVSIVAICLSLVAGFLLLKIIRTVTEKQRRYRLSLRPNSN